MAAILLLVSGERVFPAKPVGLVVVALAIAGASVFGLAAMGVPVTGEIPAGLPALGVPTLRQGINLRLVGAHGHVRDLLRADGIEEKVGGLGRFVTLEDVLAHVDKSTTV